MLRKKPSNDFTVYFRCFLHFWTLDNAVVFLILAEREDLSGCSKYYLYKATIWRLQSKNKGSLTAFIMQNEEERLISERLGEMMAVIERQQFRALHKIDVSS
jgi:hypothetical protein